MMSQASFFGGATLGGGGGASMIAGGPFSRSIYTASQSGRSSDDSMIDDKLVDSSADVWSDMKVVYKRGEQSVEVLAESDLGKDVELNLIETETIWILDMPSTSLVDDGGDEALDILERNAKYKEKLKFSRTKESNDKEGGRKKLGRGGLPGSRDKEKMRRGSLTGTGPDDLIKSKVGNDRYADRSMMTFNDALKNKNTQTTPIGTSDACVNASQWDLYDTFSKLNGDGVGEKMDEDEELVVVTEPAEPDGRGHGEAPSPEGHETGDVLLRVPVSGRTASAASGGVANAGGMTVMTTSSSVTGGLTDSIFGNSSQTAVADGTDPKGPDTTKILNSDAMKRHLMIMERAINLNSYQAKQATYRGQLVLPDVDKPPSTAPSTDLIAPPAALGQPFGTATTTERIPSTTPGSTITGRPPGTGRGSVVGGRAGGAGLKTVDIVGELDIGPSVDRLFSYQCPLTRGRNVSCIAWNKMNPDLVAIGYGQFEYAKQTGGLVCCWSIKNPEYPERVYQTAVGVVSVDFSQFHPNLLAAGLYNGSIAIFNVATSNTEHVLDSFDAVGKHSGPVWRLRWITKDRGSKEEKIEVLVSISTDGRVTQWAIRKGFESYDIMKLKRVQSKVQTQQSKTKKNDALISKFSGGLCFDFSAKDSNLYLAGTEEGHIHKCSCSYNEQYLDSYFGHSGPVYGISWSPFDSNVFLSCSADWSIRLWHQDHLQPILNLFSSTKAVCDICWSPYNSTVFACVNEGALEIWDLSQNTLDPILIHTPMATSSDHVKLTSLTFSHNSDSLLVGDSEGQVTVYQLTGMPRPHDNQVEALQQIIQSALQVVNSVS